MYIITVDGSSGWKICDHNDLYQDFNENSEWKQVRKFFLFSRSYNIVFSTQKLIL